MASSKDLSIHAVDTILKCTRLKWNQIPGEPLILSGTKVYDLAPSDNIRWRIHAVLPNLGAKFMTECMIIKTSVGSSQKRNPGHRSCFTSTEFSIHLEMRLKISKDTKREWAEFFKFLEPYMQWSVDGSKCWVIFVSGRYIWVCLEGSKHRGGKWRVG